MKNYSNIKAILNICIQIFNLPSLWLKLNQQLNCNKNLNAVDVCIFRIQNHTKIAQT